MFVYSSMTQTEAQTRKVHIDKQLQAAGWDVSDRTQVVEEFDIKVDLPEGCTGALHAVRRPPIQ